MDTEKINTWIKVIDEENHKFLELMNKLEELHKTKASKDEVLKVFKILWWFYKSHSRRNVEFMRMHWYYNAHAIERIYEIQLKNLEKLFFQIQTWKKDLDREIMSWIYEAIENNVRWDKHCALHLKHKYWAKVNDILSSIKESEKKIESKS